MTSEEALSSDEACRPTILIVGRDDPDQGKAFRALQAEFVVQRVTSAEDAIAACRVQEPDIILLASEISGSVDIETCRQFRELTDRPVILAVDHEDEALLIDVCDAGADDFILMPIKRDVLRHKIRSALRRYRVTAELRAEKASVERMAMNFLSSMGENGVLLNFTRAGLDCSSFEDLAEKLVHSAGELGVHCVVQIRHAGGPTFATSSGQPTSLDISMMEHVSGMGRVFQFRRRLVVNHSRVSVVVLDMPDESESPELAGRTRDNIAVLAESTEALCDNVDMRIESMNRAEQLQVALGTGVTAMEDLRVQFMTTLADVSQNLHELVDEVEKTYSWLSIGAESEQQISKTLNGRVQLIMTRLIEGGNFEDKFACVFDALRGSGSQGRSIELF